MGGNVKYRSRPKNILDKILFKHFLSIIYTLMIFGVLYILSGVFIAYANTKNRESYFEEKKAISSYSRLDESLFNLVSKISWQDLERDYANILQPRVSGTPGIKIVTEYIVKRLEDFNFTTQIIRHSDQVPVLAKDVRLKFYPGYDKENKGHQWGDGNVGRVPLKIEFQNILAESDPKALHSLVLACHHDSKYRLDDREYTLYLKNRLQAAPSINSPDINSEPEFLGAIDSAIPCAMILSIAQTLAPLIKCNDFLREKVTSPGTTKISFQLFFFDGEEAFDQWTDTDSLYGSRYLADLFESTRIPLQASSAITKSSSINLLERINLFVLLDLIGTAQTKFRNFYRESTPSYKRLRKIELDLHNLNLLSPSHAYGNTYFPDSTVMDGSVGDDHVPFFLKNVTNILHLISFPFPSSWHSFTDDGTNVVQDVYQDLTKILTVFMADRLKLRADKETLLRCNLI